jgi:hypothetical protein
MEYDSVLTYWTSPFQRRLIVRSQNLDNNATIPDKSSKQTYTITKKALAKISRAIENPAHRQYEAAGYQPTSTPRTQGTKFPQSVAAKWQQFHASEPPSASPTAVRQPQIRPRAASFLEAKSIKSSFRRRRTHLSHRTSPHLTKHPLSDWSTLH